MIMFDDDNMCYDYDHSDDWYNEYDEEYMEMINHQLYEDYVDEHIPETDSPYYMDDEDWYNYTFGN